MSKIKIAGVSLALVFAAAGSAFAQSSDDTVDLSKVPSTEGIVTNAASCQYEGGFLGKVEGANVCMAPIRGAEFATQAYDGQNLGVRSCSGNGSFANETTGTYCRIFLEPKPRKKTREQLERELKELTDAELEKANIDADVTN